MCIFCKIINNEIPSYKIYEDDYTLAFLDLSQATIGHTLVISKSHSSNLFDTDEETLCHLMHTVKQVSKKLQSALNIQNLNILNNSGILAGQTINHFHIHIIPRYENDNCNLIPESHEPSHEDLKKLCEHINNF